MKRCILTLVLLMRVACCSSGLVFAEDTELSPSSVLDGGYPSPSRSSFGGNLAYHSVIKKHLLPPHGLDEPMVQIVVLPSFEPEFTVQLFRCADANEKPHGARYLIRYVTATTNLYRAFSGQWKDIRGINDAAIKAQLVQIEVPKGIAEDMIKAFIGALRRTRYPETRDKYLACDGRGYYFSAWQHGYGVLSGRLEKGRKGPAGYMAGIGEDFRAYCLSRDRDRPEILDRIRSHLAKIKAVLDSPQGAEDQMRESGVSGSGQE